MKEYWKNVHLDYQISNYGNIRNKNTEKILKLNEIGRSKYLGVVVGTKKNKKMLIAHRLVAEAFIPNPKNKSQVNHIDGNTQNNHVSNLEWCSCLENINHAIDKGLIDNYAENNGMHKLTKEIVDVIKREYVPYSRNYGTRALARKYNVSKTAIYKIVNNITWVK